MPHEKRATNNEEALANNRLSELLTAISSQDADNIKALFSQTALLEAENFDEGVDYLFSLFKDEIVSIDCQKWYEEDSMEDGKKKRMLYSWHTVKTEEDTYIFFLVDCVKDEQTPNCMGLYTIRAINEKDKATQFTAYSQDMVIAGIYIPPEGNN